MRNLTYEFLLETQKAKRDAEIAAIPEYATVMVATERRDPKGKVILDSDGVPEIVEKRMLARKVKAAEWEDRLKPYAEQAHSNY